MDPGISASLQELKKTKLNLHVIASDATKLTLHLHMIPKTYTPSVAKLYKLWKPGVTQTGATYDEDTWAEFKQT